MKRLVIISHDFYHTQQSFIDFLAKQDIKVELMAFDLRITETKFNKSDLLFFSYPQPANVHDLRYQLVQNLADKKLQIINGKTFLEWPIFHKLVQKEIFLKKNIPTSPYKYFSNLNAFFEFVPQFSYPLAVKKLYGSRGKSMQIVHSQKQLLDYLSDKIVSEYFFEKFITSTIDIKAYIGKNNFFYLDIRPAMFGEQNNTDISISQQNANLIKRLSRQIADILSLDYAGIDFMIEKNKIYVLEVNRSPQLRMNLHFFQEFMKVVQ